MNSPSWLRRCVVVVLTVGQVGGCSERSSLPQVGSVHAFPVVHTVPQGPNPEVQQLNARLDELHRAINSLQQQSRADAWGDKLIGGEQIATKELLSVDLERRLGLSWTEQKAQLKEAREKLAALGELQVPDYEAYLDRAQKAAEGMSNGSETERVAAQQALQQVEQFQKRFADLKVRHTALQDAKTAQTLLEHVAKAEAIIDEAVKGNYDAIGGAGKKLQDELQQHVVGKVKDLIGDKGVKISEELIKHKQFAEELAGIARNVADSDALALLEAKEPALKEAKTNLLNAVTKFTRALAEGAAAYAGTLATMAAIGLTGPVGIAIAAIFAIVAFFRALLSGGDGDGDGASDLPGTNKTKPDSQDAAESQESTEQRPLPEQKDLGGDYSWNPTPAGNGDLVIEIRKRGEGQLATSVKLKSDAHSAIIAALKAGGCEAHFDPVPTTQGTKFATPFLITLKSPRQNRTWAVTWVSPNAYGVVVLGGGK